MKKIFGILSVVIIMVTLASCGSSHEISKLKPHLVPVTNELVKDLTPTDVQYFSGPDSVIFQRRVKEKNKEVKEGIILWRNNTLLEKIIIPPFTKGKLVMEDSGSAMIVSFDSKNDTIAFVFRPDTERLNKKGENEYALCTNEDGTVVFGEKIFKLTSSGTPLYADERQINLLKKVVHISAGNEVSKPKKEKKKNKSSNEEF